VFDAATGTGASGFVAVEDEDDDADDEAPVVVRAEGVAPASGAGCGGLPSDPAAACAEELVAHTRMHAIGTSRRRITRA
jgi:hypothetical protein